MDSQCDGSWKGDSVSILGISSCSQRRCDNVTWAITDQNEEVVRWTAFIETAATTNCMSTLSLYNQDLTASINKYGLTLTCASRAHKLHLEGQLDAADADSAPAGLERYILGLWLSRLTLSQPADLCQ